MDDAQEARDEQLAIWNGAQAQGWVDTQDLIDRLFEPFEAMLIEAVLGGPGGPVLDVGCGTGGTTRAVARRLGGAEPCTGIDISEPMLADARARAAREGLRTDFILADAQEHTFAPSQFGAVISRFGVMFFADPVRAFANLHGASKPGAALRFIAWRSAAENPFMTTAERAAAPLLPNIPPRRPHGPGQFALADDRRVREILTRAGWGGIEIRPVDVICAMPEPELERYITRLGPLGRVLHEADGETRDRVIRTVRAAFAPFVQGSDVRFTAACWMASAWA